MPELIDLTEQRFGRLVVIRRNGKNKHNHVIWLCLCDCGTEINVISDRLRNGNTKSCGCFRREINTKHGHRTRIKTTQTYRSWSQMIQRCNNPNYNNYYRYGGRGIAVCERWLKFENFLKDMGESPKGYQIDRINSNGNYKLDNCKWSTPQEQQRNRCNNRLITYQGRTQCLSAWSEELGIDYNRLYQRLYRLNWLSVEKAFTIP